MVTAPGGTVKILFGFRGVPFHQRLNHWVGISETFVPSAAPSYSNLSNSKDFIKKFLATKSKLFGNYRENLILDIPVGVKEWYVAVADMGTGTRSGFQSMTIDAKIEAVAVQSH